MKAGYIYYFEWKTWITTDYMEVPTKIYQTIHAGEERIKQLMDNPWSLEKEYPHIVNKLIEKTQQQVSDILEDDDDMTDLCGFNMQD